MKAPIPLQLLYPERVNLGAGRDIREGWLNLDRSPLRGIDKVGDATDLSFITDGTITELRAARVLEYFTLAKTRKAFTEWRRGIVPGGDLFISTSNLWQSWRSEVENGNRGTDLARMLEETPRRREWHPMSITILLVQRLLRDAGWEPGQPVLNLRRTIVHWNATAR